MREAFRRAFEDVRNGRHREAYALFLIGVILTALGLTGLVGQQVLLSAILLAVSFVIFHTAAAAENQQPALDQVLHSREDFGAFSKLLPGVRDLKIYGPTAVHVLVNSADIRRFILDRGGKVQVIVQDSSPELATLAGAQLDDNLDFTRTLENSLATLAKLAAHPGFSYRTLSVNPGFSLVIVNADDHDGYLIFESHGFKDDNISDRMHIVIRKQESDRWFSYWVSRFRAMWEAALPGANGDPAGN
jgi:hypothetical protein